MPETFFDNASIDPAETPVFVPRATPSDGPALDRVERTLQRLDELQELLAVEDDYDVPPLQYALPANFKLSVVMPVYNEENTLRRIVARVLAQPIPKEVIIVDDHSIDCTRDVLEQLEIVPDLHVIYKPRNEGKGAAVRTGLAHATGNVVVVQDADLEYDPRDIPRLLRPIVNGQTDVVYGSRFLEGWPPSSSLAHRLGNGMLTRLSNAMTGQKLTDMETCYKVFRREVLRDVTIEQDRFGFEPEITAKIARGGHRILEMPISYDARNWQDGKKIGFRDGINAMYCIMRYAWRD